MKRMYHQSEHIKGTPKKGSHGPSLKGGIDRNAHLKQREPVLTVAPTPPARFAVTLPDGYRSVLDPRDCSDWARAVA